MGESQVFSPRMPSTKNEGESNVAGKPYRYKAN